MTISWAEKTCLAFHKSKNYRVGGVDGVSKSKKKNFTLSKTIDQRKPSNAGSFSKMSFSSRDSAVTLTNSGGCLFCPPKSKWVTVLHWALPNENEHILARHAFHRRTVNHILLASRGEAKIGSAELWQVAAFTTDIWFRLFGKKILRGSDSICGAHRGAAKWTPISQLM